MKFSLRSFGFLSLTSLLPLGCDTHTADLPTSQNMCTEMGLGTYEFQLMTVASFMNDSGSFEAKETTSLLVDDDDQTDDYPDYLRVIELADELLAEDPQAVQTYAAITDEVELSAEEQAAIDFVEGVFTELATICRRLEPGVGDFMPAPGEDVSVGVYPYFSACKDKFNESGDGVIGIVDLDREGGAPQDAALSNCVTLDGADNQRAVNLWGPLTTMPSDFDGLPAEVVDGFTYSGLTVAVYESAWKQVADLSEWEGVAFWARLANKEEAVAIPGDGEPLAGADIPPDARPQDGVGQIGVSIQTMDTISVQDGKGAITEINPYGVCTGAEMDGVLCFEDQAAFDAFPGMVVPGSDGQQKYAFSTDTDELDTPEVPFCQDYVPTEVVVGQETPYRDQCWDGFRSLRDVTPEWRFYFFPFSEMRQAGWGRVGKSFRTDRIKSVSILTSAFQPINIMFDEVAFYRTKPEAEE